MLLVAVLVLLGEERGAVQRARVGSFGHKRLGELAHAALEDVTVALHFHRVRVALRRKAVQVQAETVDRRRRLVVSPA